MGMGLAFYLLAVVVVLGGCASVPPGGGEAAPPSPVAQVYSNVELQFQLLAAADAPRCAGVDCALNAGFDRQIQRLGGRLAASAYVAYPDLRQRVPEFKFVVAEKAAPDTASNAGGTIVVYRGVQGLHLEEDTLAFAVAREMGHVIARHHDRNAAKGLLISVIADALFPMTNLLQGAAAFLPSGLASFVGTHLMEAHDSPGQARQADVVALHLLAGLGWSGQEMDDAFVVATRSLSKDRWSLDLRQSIMTADTSAYYWPAADEATAEAASPTGPFAPGPFALGESGSSQR
jgi:predicted Zn-dependent protease